MLVASRQSPVFPSSSKTAQEHFSTQKQKGARQFTRSPLAPILEEDVVTKESQASPYQHNMKTLRTPASNPSVHSKNGKQNTASTMPSKNIATRQLHFGPMQKLTPFSVAEGKAAQAKELKNNHNQNATKRWCGCGHDNPPSESLGYRNLSEIRNKKELDHLSLPLSDKEKLALLNAATTRDSKHPTSLKDLAPHIQQIPPRRESQKTIRFSDPAYSAKHVMRGWCGNNDNYSSGHTFSSASSEYQNNHSEVRNTVNLKQPSPLLYKEKPATLNTTATKGATPALSQRMLFQTSKIQLQQMNQEGQKPWGANYNQPSRVPHSPAILAF